MDPFVLLQRVVPQKALTVLVGFFADVKWRPLKSLIIRCFAAKYKVDLSQAVSESGSDEPATPAQYASFNEFFTRQLKPDARPMSDVADSIASPADGMISQVGAIENGRLLQAKGIDYSLAELLGDKHTADLFECGAFATIYLSPRDYHRVHMPIDGSPESMMYIPGKLFSVNPRTAANVDALFARNERLVTIFKNGDDPFALVMVGAMIVAGIETVLTGRIKRCKQIKEVPFEPRPIGKGEEFGRFHLGSTAIVVVPKSMKVQWDQNRTPNTPVQVRELLGRSST